MNADCVSLKFYRVLNPLENVHIVGHVGLHQQLLLNLQKAFQICERDALLARPKNAQRKLFQNNKFIPGFFQRRHNFHCLANIVANVRKSAPNTANLPAEIM